jgi:tetratricopeptide (TPR) repeat protein
LLKLAERYEQQGNYEGALRVYTQVAKVDPDNSRARESIASLSTTAGRAASQPERGIAAYQSKSKSAERNSAVVASESPPATGDASIADRWSPESEVASADQTLPAVHPARSQEWASLAAEGDADSERMTASAAAEPAWWQATTEGEIDARPEPAAGWSASTETVATADWANPGPGALELLTSADADDRKVALAELVHRGIHGTEAVDAAQRLAAADPDLVVRAYAASTLWRLTHHADAPVAALTGLLVSEDETVLQVASYLLGAIGPSAADAIPDLRQLCDRSSGATRVHAAEALARIDAGSHEAVGLLTAALGDRDEETRWLSAIALGGVGRELREDAVSALTAALQDPSEGIRSVAALTLGGFGPDALSAVPQLERAASLESEEVRTAAQTALACIIR